MYHLRNVESFGILWSGETYTTLQRYLRYRDFPEDLVKSIFIPLPKKPMAIECGDHRLISLIPHATKIFLRVILNRVKQLIDNKAQFGFRPERGTREGIFSFNVMAPKHLEVKKEMYLFFIDYFKAFDRVKHDNLW